MAFTGRKNSRLNFGAIPPAWNDNIFTFVSFKHGKITCCDTDKVAARMEKGIPEQARDTRRAHLAQTLASDGAILWRSNLDDSEKFEAVSLVVSRNAVVAVVRMQNALRARPQQFLVAFNARNGRQLWRHELRGEPLPGGLLIDSDGRIIVTLLSGKLVCLGIDG